MSTIDQLKEKWGETHGVNPNPGAYDSDSFRKIVKSRVRKHTNKAMQYFWASFALQIIVYALLSHVIVRYWHDGSILFPAIAGVLLFIPFTIILMRKFKAIATTRPQVQPGDAAENSLHRYIAVRRNLLDSFYRFKRRYELMLIPLASAIGVFITFKLYIPGGVQAHQDEAIIAFAITIASCAVAIGVENRKNFREPLQQFDSILEEFRDKE